MATSGSAGQTDSLAVPWLCSYESGCGQCVPEWAGLWQKPALGRIGPQAVVWPLEPSLTHRQVPPDCPDPSPATVLEPLASFRGDVRCRLDPITPPFGVQLFLITLGIKSEVRTPVATARPLRASQGPQQASLPLCLLLASPRSVLCPQASCPASCCSLCRRNRKVT